MARSASSIRGLVKARDAVFRTMGYVPRRFDVPRSEVSPADAIERCSHDAQLRRIVQPPKDSAAPPSMNELSKLGLRQTFGPQE